MRESEWIEGHPYLAGVAAFQALADGAAAQAAPLPGDGVWEAAGAELEAGVPLLRGRAAPPGVVRAGAAALREVVARVAEAGVAPPIADSAKAILARLDRDAGGAEEAVRWLVRGAPAEGAPPEGGLLRFLGWAALRRVLAPVVAGFDREREGGRWRGAVCPTCGSPPAMGILVPAADGRARRLACGCCGTRWAFQRVSCPFCGNEEADRLALLEIEQEAGLRLDVCEDCKGYLKTSTAEENAQLFLADWPTLHLDVLAQARGYRRLGASLYELEVAGT